MELRRAGDGYDPCLLRKQPAEGDLRRSGLLLLCESAEHIDQSLIRFSIVRREARNNTPEVALVELRIFVDRAGEESLAGEYTPIHLLAVVVSVVVAVPRRADISRRPVCKQAWRHFTRPQATSQEILVLVPYAL